MGLTIRHRSGTDQELEMLNEPQTGLLLQDPKGQVQQESMGGTDPDAGTDAINNKSSFGTPFIIETVINAEDASGAATDVLTGVGDSDVFPAYDAAGIAAGTVAVLATGCPFKLKILDVWVVALTENTKNASDTIMVQHVATNTTTQVDITDAMSLDINDHVLVRPASINQDACVIDVTENIRFDIVLGSTNVHRAYKVYMLCMRCTPDE